MPFFHGAIGSPMVSAHAYQIMFASQKTQNEIRFHFSNYMFRTLTVLYTTVKQIFSKGTRGIDRDGKMWSEREWYGTGMRNRRILRFGADSSRVGVCVGIVGRGKAGCGRNNADVAFVPGTLTFWFSGFELFGRGGVGF